MHDPLRREQRLPALVAPGDTELEIPVALRPFAEPLLLRGENEQEFRRLSAAIIAEIAPTTTLQWLYTLDLVEICWEIPRYRRLRSRALDMERAQAIETLLSRCEGAGLPPSACEAVTRHAKIIAAEWRSDPVAARQIESRLNQLGVDELAIETEAFIRSQALFGLFQDLIESAERRRTMILRDLISQRRNQ